MRITSAASLATDLDPVTAVVLAVASGSTAITCCIPARRMPTDQPLSSHFRSAAFPLWVPTLG